MPCVLVTRHGKKQEHVINTEKINQNTPRFGTGRQGSYNSSYKYDHNAQNTRGNHDYDKK